MNLDGYRATVLKAAVEGRLTEKWRATHPDVEPAEKLLERILAERRKKWEEAQLAKYAEKRQSPPKGWKDRYPEPVKPDVSALPDVPPLRPERVPALLRACHSIKAKRLFLALSERLSHAWFKHLDLKKVDLGTGKRSLFPGGKLDAKYQITLPADIDEHAR